MKSQFYSPREEFEKQLAMSPEEKQEKQKLVESMFAAHDAKKEDVTE